MTLREDTIESEDQESPLGVSLRPAMLAPDEDGTDQLEQDFALLEAELNHLAESGVGFLNVNQAIKFLGVSRQTIWEMRRRFVQMEEARERGEEPQSTGPFLPWVSLGQNDGGIRIPITSVIRLFQDRKASSNKRPPVADQGDEAAAPAVIG